MTRVYNAVLAVSVIIFIISVITGTQKASSDQQKMSIERFDENIGGVTVTYDNKDTREGYGVQETRTLQEIWDNDKLPFYSVFSSRNPDWYFNLLGENDGKSVFSAHWYADDILRTLVQPLGSAKNIYFTLAQNERSSVDEKTVFSLLTIRR